MKIKSIEPLKDEDIKVKISTCNKCSGQVRVALTHYLTPKSTKEFMNEVMKYNLSVNEVYLLDYKKSIIKHCNC
jgi:hypothetical protein